MNSQFKNIGVVIRPATPHIHATAIEVVEFLLEEGISVHIDEEFAVEVMNTSIFQESKIVSKANMGKVCDLVLSLGGDGTLLSIARKIAPYRVPLIGINRGRLGFLTQIPCDNAIESIEKMLEGQYIAEERTMLESTIYRNDEPVRTSLALNDVVFSRGGMGQMIEFEVFINKEFVYTQHSDGLIVSTPTGSTAYALAAGGPMIQTAVRAFSLVPICPQSLNNRPIAVSDTGSIEVLMTKCLDARVHFDGQSYFDLQPLDRIKINRYQNSLRMLHPTDYSYFKTLRQKLHWGEQLI